MRRWAMWRSFRDYFPIKLVKTAELDARSNYLLCAYPHGIISTGVFGAFGTEAAAVGDLFPGMEPVLVTLPQHFSSPFVRELALSLGEREGGRGRGRGQRDKAVEMLDHLYSK